MNVTLKSYPVSECFPKEDHVQTDMKVYPFMKGLLTFVNSIGYAGRLFVMVNGQTGNLVNTVDREGGNILRLLQVLTAQKRIQADVIVAGADEKMSDFHLYVLAKQNGGIYAPLSVDKDEDTRDLEALFEGFAAISSYSSSRNIVYDGALKADGDVVAFESTAGRRLIVFISCKSDHDQDLAVVNGDKEKVVSRFQHYTVAVDEKLTVRFTAPAPEAFCYLQAIEFGRSLFPVVPSFTLLEPSTDLVILEPSFDSGRSGFIVEFSWGSHHLPKPTGCSLKWIGNSELMLGLAGKECERYRVDFIPTQSSHLLLQYTIQSVPLSHVLPYLFRSPGDHPLQPVNFQMDPQETTSGIYSSSLTRYTVDLTAQRDISLKTSSLDVSLTPEDGRRRMRLGTVFGCRPNGSVVAPVDVSQVPAASISLQTIRESCGRRFGSGGMAALFKLCQIDFVEAGPNDDNLQKGMAPSLSYHCEFVSGIKPKTKLAKSPLRMPLINMSYHGNTDIQNPSKVCFHQKPAKIDPENCGRRRWFVSYPIRDVDRVHVSTWPAQSVKSIKLIFRLLSLRNELKMLLMEGDCCMRNVTLLPFSMVSNFVGNAGIIQVDPNYLQPMKIKRSGLELWQIMLLTLLALLVVISLSAVRQQCLAVHQHSPPPTHPHSVDKHRLQKSLSPSSGQNIDNLCRANRNDDLISLKSSQQGGSYKQLETRC